MTKKDYKTIAAVIEWLDIGPASKEIIAHALADVFIRDNWQFDREKFYRACGVHCG